jgi:peptide/nickel transport system ATP-binding protein
MSRPNLRTLRQNLQMVFQDPVDSLNPRMTVERNIADPLKMLNLSAVEMDRRIDDVLRDVGLGSAFRDLYPRRLSGGQAQRVALARALSIDPKLIVFDEPTSALDVTVQAQILDLLRRLMAKGDRAYVFVSHDLATVRNLCSRVAVLYLGRIVESGPAEAIFDNPLHPYTRALLESAPSLTQATRAASVVLARDLDEASPAEGCPLLPRCPFAQDECIEPQSLRRGNNTHEVACWKVGS